VGISEDLLINPQVVPSLLKWCNAHVSTFDRPMSELAVILPEPDWASAFTSHHSSSGGFIDETFMIWQAEQVQLLA
jgi:hypothetical protein